MSTASRIALPILKVWKPREPAASPFADLVRGKAASILHRQIHRARKLIGGTGLGSVLVRSVAGTGAVRIGAMLASFLVGVQLARGLGVEGYGYYGLALSIVTIAGLPGELGLSRLVTRETAAASATNNPPHLFGVLRWANRTGLAMSTVAMLAVVAAAIIAINRGSPELGLALLLGAPVIPLMTLARVNGGALQGLHHIVRGQIPQNLLRPLFLSMLLFGVVLAGVSLQPPLAMALNALTALLALFITFVWLRQRLPPPPRVAVENVSGGRRWFSSMVPMALTEGMRVLQVELSILLIGLVAAPAAVGLFRIANVTATTAAAAVGVVNRVAFPVVARLHAEQDAAGLQKAVTGLAWAGFAGVVLLSLPLLLAAEPLLRLVFGASYGPAATALRILAVGQMFNGAFGPNVALLNMTHHERRVTRAMGIALVLNIILVPILMARWGIEGAALGLVASLLCWNVLTWLDARRLLGVETSILPPRLLARQARR